MDTLKLISVKQASNGDEMSMQQIQIWSMFLLSNYGIHTYSPSDFFDEEDYENEDWDEDEEYKDEDSRDSESNPLAEQIVTRVWYWTSPSGDVYSLVDTYGWMGYYNEGVIHVNGFPRIDNDNSTLGWIGESIPGFDLELFAAIRKLLFECASVGLDALKLDYPEDLETQDEIIAFEFLCANPEFVTMEADITWD